MTTQAYLNKTRARTVAIVLCMIAVFFNCRSGFSAPSCDLSLSVQNINLVWNLGMPAQQVTFTVRKNAVAPCSYIVTFSKGSASDYSSRRLLSGSEILNYQLYKESSLSNILKDMGDFTSQAEVVSGSFAHGSNLTHTHTYYLDIPEGPATNPRLKPSGQYTDTFTMRVYRDLPHFDSEEDTKSVRIQTTVPRNVQLSLVNTGGAFNPSDTTQSINFGTLTSGASRSFDLRVLTNAGYDVTFSSQNNGVLKHANPQISTTVPYSLRVNGIEKQLTSSRDNPVSVAHGSGQTTLTGNLNTVDVMIDSANEKMEGIYTDIIIVTAAATE